MLRALLCRELRLGAVGLNEAVLARPLRVGAFAAAPPSGLLQNQMVGEPQTDSPASRDLTTVNWHVSPFCNYKCSFCYAHFASVEPLPVDRGLALLTALRSVGLYKVNFAGGEPLLNPYLPCYLEFSKDLGFMTSIITNGSLFSADWCRASLPFCDQVGLSCDSLCDRTNAALGRGRGRHVESLEAALELIRRANSDKENVRVKLNTVIMANNHHEDWTRFFRSHPEISRWKIFQMLKIEGENDEAFDRLSVSDDLFHGFVERHAGLKGCGLDIVPEDNDAMTSSYLMVTPDGRFYQNSAQSRYHYSEPILAVGVEAALGQVGFDLDKFVSRGGAYAL